MTLPSGPNLLPPSGPGLLPQSGPSLLPPSAPSLLPPSGPSLLPSSGPSLLPPSGPSLLPPSGPSLLLPSGPFLGLPRGTPAVEAASGPSLVVPSVPSSKELTMQGLSIPSLNVNLLPPAKVTKDEPGHQQFSIPTPGPPRPRSPAVEIPPRRGLQPVRKRSSIIPRDMNHLKNEMVMSNLLKEIYGISYHCDVRTMNVKEKLSEPGDITGNLSESGKVIVSLVMNSGETMDFNWFVKILPKEHKNSELMHKFNIFENEIRFYTELVPKLLYAESKDDAGAVIILEDAGVLGYTQDRDENGGRFLSQEKALLAISSIARIHAASRLYNLHNNVKLEEKHSILGETSNAMWEDENFIERLSAMKDSYCEVLKKSSEHDSARLLQRFETAFDSSMKLKSLCAERFAPKKMSVSYLQHGDFHFNNLLFKEEVDEPMKVMIVDWQLTYMGRSTGDISYLLLSSISPEVRRSKEQELKEAYYTAFNSYLKTFEAAVMDKLSHNNTGISFSVFCDDDRNGVEVEIDRDELEHDYHDSSPLSFFLSCGNVLNSETTNTPLSASPASSMIHSESDRESTHSPALVTYAYNMVKDAADMDII